MDRERIAVLKQNRDRIDAREKFSKKYITLHSIYGSNASKYYETFKENFYEVKNADELLEIKGLLYLEDGSIRKNKSEYLEYAGVTELEALTDGLERILAVMRTITDERFIYADIAHVAKNARYDFFEKYGMLPEQLPLEMVSIKKVKRYLGNISKQSATYFSYKKAELEKNNQISSDADNEKNNQIEKHPVLFVNNKSLVGFKKDDDYGMNR